MINKHKDAIITIFSTAGKPLSLKDILTLLKVFDVDKDYSNPQSFRVNTAVELRKLVNEDKLKIAFVKKEHSGRPKRYYTLNREKYNKDYILTEANREIIRQWNESW